MSHWIASVISYSPRHDGSSVSAASRIESSNRYTPTSAEVADELLRLLDQTHHAIAFEHRDAEPLRFGNSREEDLGIRARALELLDESPEPFEQDVVAQVHQERLARDEVAGRENGVRETERLFLRDVGDREPPRRAVPDGGADLVAGLADHDPDFGDAHVSDRLERVEQDRRPGDGNQLLRVRVRERSQARPLALPPG